MKNFMPANRLPGKRECSGDCGSAEALYTTCAGAIAKANVEVQVRTWVYGGKRQIKVNYSSYFLEVIIQPIVNFIIRGSSKPSTQVDYIILQT